MKLPSFLGKWYVKNEILNNYGNIEMTKLKKFFSFKIG